MKEEKDQDKKDNYYSLFILSIIVILCWGLNYYLLKDQSNEAKSATGEMFGVVSSLFAGLAFAGVIYTIQLQRKELSLQRSELRETRLEFETQNETLKKQRFENTYFQMLNLHHEIVTNLEYTSDYGEFKGREIFKRFLVEMTDSMQKHLFISKPHGNEEKSISLTELTEKIELEYCNLFEDHFNTYLGHYFRNLYHIYKFVYFSDLISKEEKGFYASLIRAQLSEEELETSVFNAITEGYGNPNFTFLMKEYDMLKNMNWKSKFLGSKIESLYVELLSNIINPFRK